MVKPTRENVFGIIDEINVDFLVRFINIHHACVETEVRKLPGKDRELISENLKRLGMIANAACFLLLYSHVEEMLFHLWKIRLGQSPPEGNSGLKRHKEMLRELSIDPGQSEPWSQLKDAEKIRHCLLHANGRVDLMRNPSEVTGAVSRHSKGLSIEANRIVIEKGYLDEFLTTIRELRTCLLNSPESGLISVVR